MSDMECPYCGAGQTVCHDDGQGYEESVRHEHECKACKKTFVFTTTISFSYSPAKADCLNDSPHEFVLSKSYPRKYSRMRCKHCDFDRAPTAEEFSSADIKEQELA